MGYNLLIRPSQGRILQDSCSVVPARHFFLEKTAVFSGTASPQDETPILECPRQVIRPGCVRYIRALFIRKHAVASVQAFPRHLYPLL